MNCTAYNEFDRMFIECTMFLGNIKVAPMAVLAIFMVLLVLIMVRIDKLIILLVRWFGQRKSRLIFLTRIDEDGEAFSAGDQ